MTLPKKGQSLTMPKLQYYQVWSATSNKMFKIILHRLMLQAEEIIAKEKGWISSWVKHHKRDVLHKTLTIPTKYLPSLHRPQRSFCLTVWHKTLWVTMSKYNMGKIHTIQQLYRVNSTILFQRSIEKWSSHITWHMLRLCLLSPMLFNIFLEHILWETSGNSQH